MGFGEWINYMPYMEYITCIYKYIGICKYIGLARTIHIQCVYGIFGREITKSTVIYGAYIRFWPTLQIYVDSQTCTRPSNTQTQTAQVLYEEAIASIHKCIGICRYM